MTTLFYLLGYLALLGFICTAFLKIRSYLKSSPLHVRWELYPVPHEGAKSSYGGSFMEEKDWWRKPRHIEHLGDIKALLFEVLVLHTTFEHNLKLWFRTYPFHVGMYMLMGGIIIVFASVVLQAFGLAPDSGLLVFVGNVINAVVLLGGLCIVGGGIALIHHRKTDEGLKKYTTPEHYFNLGVFVFFGILALLAWICAPSYFVMARDFMYNMFTVNFVPLPSTFFALHLLLGFFLMIWLPMTHMGHLLMKYFTYHDIRWGDTPTTYNKETKRKIPDMLKYSASWSAEHICGNGAPKTWLEIATTNPAAPKNEA
ncbi:MAG: nitrate reductase [Desulfovibrio sp.]|jgi:nitrate reductase gamma subunit|nr:nitrate reductase [Desulfovibrio sp.]